MRAMYGVWGACLLLVGASAYAQVNQNQLTAVGPVNPATGFPVWYEDANGLRLELCTDTSGFCLEVPPDPTQPPSVPGNFPGEAFWWAADASMPTNGDGEALLVLALEAAFTTEAPAAGEQIVFGRIRVRIDNLVAGATYTVTHPFGVDSFVAQAAGRRGINVTEDIGCAAGPCDFSLALNSRVGPFLVWDPAVPPAAPPGYIGDPNVLHPVVGSPFGTNIFRVEGPNVGGPGVNVIQTNLFAVQGKVFVPPPVGTLGVSTSLLDFGTALLGETRGPQAISLENLGNGALEIGSLALAGGNTGDFDLVLDPCSGATLLPGASCVVTVSFTPSAEGTRSTLLQIPTSDPAGPQQVGLTGRGRDPSTPVGSVGPINLDHGFPEFYEDVTGLRLRLCLDADGECLETVPNPALPPAVPGNFPAEAFWWAADADMPTSGDGEARLVLAMEAAFVTEEPLPGDQMTFGRVRVRAENVVPGAIYTVTHPFGVDTVIAEDDGSINVTEDIGCASSPCDFAAALDSRVTTFLRWDPAVPPAAPTGQIGSPGTPHPVIGSPFGTNVFRIEGPNIGGPGVDVIQTDLFNVQGKLYEPVGPVVRVAPQLVDFGTVLVGGPVARSVTVENVGTAPALLGTVT
ncbi:MAG: choice-of-anchor D domain-containing protein, partial [Myxococcaceae bacterium]